MADYADEGMVTVMTAIEDLEQAVEVQRLYLRRYSKHSYSLRFDPQWGTWTLVRPKTSIAEDEGF